MKYLFLGKQKCLQILSRVSCECSIVSKEHISYGDLFTFRFVFKRAGLKRRPSHVVSSLNSKVDEQKARFNSIGKNPKNGWYKDASLLYPTFNSKWIRNITIILDSCLRIGMKRLQNIKNAGGQLISNNIANNLSLLIISNT